MGVKLGKGKTLSLAKGFNYAYVGLGWDTNRYKGSADFDLDASAVLLAADGKVSCDEDFIFYGNLKSRKCAVVHTGDNLTGEGDGDDEVLLIAFDKIPMNVETVKIYVTIFEAKKRNQNFGTVSNAFIRVCRIDEYAFANYDKPGVDITPDSSAEEIRFDLTEYYSVETAVEVGSFIRNDDNSWSFTANGTGFSGGMLSLCQACGIEVDETEDGSSF